MGLLDQYNALSDNAQQYVLNKLASFGNGVGNTVQAIPANANRLAQGLLNLPQQASTELNQLASPQTRNKLAGLLAQPQQANPQQWMDKGLELAGLAPVGGLIGTVKAYHGSTRLGDSWFDNGMLGTNSYRYRDTELGHFASANPKVSNEFAGAPLENVYPVSQYGNQAASLKDYKNIIPSEPVSGAAVYPVAVNLKNPKVMTAAEYRKTFFDDASPDVAQIKNDLISAGHDGIKIIGDPRSDWGELRATNYVAFDGSSFVPWFERK